MSKLVLTINYLGCYMENEWQCTAMKGETPAKNLSSAGEALWQLNQVVSNKNRNKQDLDVFWRIPDFASGLDVEPQGKRRINSQIFDLSMLQ